MKDLKHPKSRLVVFEDVTTQERFLINSTHPTEETTLCEGLVFPLVKVEVSSSSHPAYHLKKAVAPPRSRRDEFYEKYKR